MKSLQSQPKTYFSTIIGLALLIMAWITFTPAQFGGRAVYLVISGVSMEPSFYDGDLVILHQTDTYQLGDIAAYYHPIAEGIVIHRIVRQQGDRFILLGDNKPEVDTYRPTSAEMIGKFWLHVPVVGNIVSQLKSQGLLSSGIIVIILIILLIPSIISGQNQQQQRQHRHSSKQKRSPRMDRLNLSKINQADLIFFLIILAVASAVLAFFGFKQSLSKTVSNDMTYKQSGIFSYSADAPPSIYNSNVAQTGAPIFRALINQVTVNFDYQLTSDFFTEVAGTYRLVAELSHANGWDWTIELLPETSFSGHTFSISSDLDLSEVQTLIDNLEQQTGLQGQRYSLAIVPEVSINGTLNGQPLQDEFSPRLSFDFDATQMQLADNHSRQFNSSQEDPLKPSQVGTIASTVETPNVISILGVNLTVSSVRQISIGGMIVSLGGLLILGLLMFRTQQEDEISQIQFKYASLLINIRETGAEVAGEMIEVATIDDLVKLAERDGSMILHHARGDLHQYLVKAGRVTYRYQVRNRQASSQLSILKRVQ